MEGFEEIGGQVFGDGMVEFGGDGRRECWGEFLDIDFVSMFPWLCRELIEEDVKRKVDFGFFIFLGTGIEELDFIGDLAFDERDNALEGEEVIVPRGDNDSDDGEVSDMESEVFEREFFFECDFKDIQNEEYKESNEPRAMEDIMELEEEDELCDNFSKGLDIIGERLEWDASILRDKSGNESGKGDTE